MKAVLEGEMNMLSKVLLLSFVIVLGSSTLVKADAVTDLIAKLPENYKNIPVKSDENLNLIKDPKVRDELVTFCKSCAETSKSVSMGVGGNMTQKACSNEHCHTLCPIKNLPDVCK
jgi:hypothetical protein